MGIRKRLTSIEARFLQKPEAVRKWLDGFSKRSPALVGREIYDTIQNREEFADLRDRVKLQEKGGERYIDVPQGTKLTVLQVQNAYQVKVGGILIKSREGRPAGTYDYRTGMAKGKK